MSTEIELTKSGGVATLTLHAPQRRNALTPSMAEDLIGAIDEIDGDDAIGAAVLHGEGGYFCAGADLSTLGGAKSDPASAASFGAIGTLYSAFVRVGRSAVPVVAAIEGGAVGAGVNLMMAADLRIVAQDVKVLSGFSRVKVHPGGGHFALLMRSGRREAAAALGVFGEVLDGHDCVAHGLAWRSVSPGDTLETAASYAQRVAADPGLARKVVESFRLEAGPPALSWDAALGVERAAQMWSMRRASETQ